MSRFLIRTQEVYRVDSESEAKILIEEAKKEKTGTLTKYSSEYKERKAKGEVIDDWYKVTLNKVFQEEKEPEDVIDIKYEKQAYNSGFPTYIGGEE